MGICRCSFPALILVVGLVLSQTPGLLRAARLGEEQGATSGSAEFESASIKLADPAGPATVPILKGGPGTTDPGYVRCASCPLDSLLLRAFGIGQHQLAGGPEWLKTQIQIVARVPTGTTAEQSRAMLRNLLVQRFKLVFHWTKEERRGFELKVAKDGAKLTESAGVEQKPEPGTAQRVDLPGTAIRVGPGVPTSGVMSLTQPNGLIRTAGRRATLEELVQYLSVSLGQTVVDATGLNGKYDFALTWSLGAASDAPTGDGVASASEPQPTLADALRKLGLTLEAKRVVVDVLVIDQGERIPIEN
jgi:bla regulator protein blaR1